MADRRSSRVEFTPTEAAALYERALKEKPDDPQAHFDLGVAYYISGDYEAAQREFEETVRLAPSHEHAHYYLGVLAARHGEKDRARREFESVANSAAHTILKSQAKLQMRNL
jgi:tetratricopeptide (TPR) repeat protein